MGVTGLWQVLSPCARPIKLETLNKKRLAVDASIWIYQFLKAVRDKEGNALRNSHVVGFFRRICKLLFFGIKPVFVFDGGAPALKRATISGRKRRREGRREDAVRTAGKLLAVQMQRLAEEEDRKRREERDGLRSGHEEQSEEALPDNLVYVDELQMTPQERQQTRRFKKKDAYHLPELDVSLSEMGAPNDPRIMSQEELEEYARQFNSGEDINLYDFSKIDFNSPFFLSLPASDRYNILNAARLRSRLRMGYSKDQLDTMFPDRMAFSRFQIERVKERNELTQRLMNINGMNGEDTMFGLDNGGRVAGEKGREYILVKNDGVEGGWALGVVGGKDEGKRNQPINVDEYLPPSDVQESGQDDYEWEDVEEGFEDVPIEGLNRLPKRTNSDLRPTFGSNEDEILRKRNAFYKSRRQPAVSRMSGKKPKGTTESESLFVEDDQAAPLLPEEIEDDLFQDLNEESLTEEEQLSRAIALSLEQPFDFDTPDDGVKETDDGSHKLNETEAPNILENDSDDEDEIDFQAALAEARRSKHHSQAAPRPRSRSRSKSPSRKIASTEAHGSSKNLFSGPLPFEKLEFRGCTPKHPEKSAGGGEAGGFIRDASEKEMKKKKAEPLPPWFEAHGHLAKDLYDNSVGEEVQFDGGNPERLIRKREDGLLNGSNANEVVDVDAPPNAKNLPDIIPVDSTDSDEGDMEMEDVPLVNEPGPMNDVADLVRTEPPNSAIPESTQVDQISPPNHDLAENSEEEIYDWEESDHEKDQLSNNVSEPQTRQDGPLSTRLLDQNLQHAPRPTPRQLDAHEDASIITDGNITDLPHSMHPGGYDIEAPEQDEYSDPEDEDLMQQLATEAEEHARFAATLNSNTHIQSAQDYEKELRQLRNQQKKDRRDADEVTHIMVTECQQLLKLFGLPYITAPMEAEAQCAELVSLGLVDGIVTDDSDTFLFGGTRVYKNMFNQAKFVECYLASDLEKEFDLDRNKLIRLAHLLGSDYTDGIPLVGPVTALEILSEFSSERGLEDFKEWWTSVQMGQKAGPEESAFRKKFRRNATKIFLPPTFPDPRVQEAYLHPEVDSDPSDFAWGVPDLDALRQFLMATIGWTQDRTDEVLVPVIKDMNRRDLEGTQANITNFFGGGIGAGAFAPRKRKEGKSRRMENALGRLQAQAVARRQTEHCDGSDHDDQNAESDSPRVAADREHTPVPGKRRAARDNSSEIHSGEERSSAPEAPPKKPKPGRSSRARKRRK